MHCVAPWFELNISSADDCVSACCYYGGAKDAWSNDPVSLEEYWNSENFQRLRTINSPWRSEVPEDKAKGCENCFYFRNREESASYFPAFFSFASDLSAEQLENWQLAVEDYKDSRRVARSTPLRFYINFGFACNLSCTMCHQVPRRKSLKRQVDADILTRWKPQFRRAIDVTVIGGEPFAMPEAIKFIRAFIDDPELENVQLTICTNGTVHHKHMKTLVKKRKLQLTVSLDTIGAEYEKIRVGAKWSQVDENIRMFLDAGVKLGYPWQAQSPALVLKTNVQRLYDFTEWAISNNVQPGFYDFIDAPGIEHTFETENIVAHPHLLDEIPGWRGHFQSAIHLLEGSQFSGAGAQLKMLYARVLEIMRGCATAARQ